MRLMYHRHVKQPAGSPCGACPALQAPVQDDVLPGARKKLSDWLPRGHLPVVRPGLSSKAGALVRRPQFLDTPGCFLARAKQEGKPAPVRSSLVGVAGQVSHHLGKVSTLGYEVAFSHLPATDPGTGEGDARTAWRGGTGSVWHVDFRRSAGFNFGGTPGAMPT
jgi:hypothetical protein